MRRSDKTIPVTMARKIPDEKDKAAAARLRALWKEAREKDPSLTQERAAHVMDISQTAVSRYLSGKIPLGVTATLRWAELLDVDPDEIRTDLPDLAGLSRVDDVLLSEIISDVDQIARESGYRLSESKKAGLVASIYALATRTGKVDKGAIMALIHYASREKSAG